MWVNKQHVFLPELDQPWCKTHAQIPTVDVLDDDLLRIYYSTRDSSSRSYTSYVETLQSDPTKVTYVHDQPIVPLGELGAFDDCGVMPSCIVTHEGVKYLYYIGWNVRNTVRYQNSIGILVSEDGGKTFRRLFEGPVIDRNHIEPHFVVTPYILIENGIWRMWYCGCTKWHTINGITEPQYQIKYAESKDGIIWSRANTVSIPYATELEANVRASVVKDGDLYKMWYSYRSLENYREIAASGYKIGYAESSDGISWDRMDEKAGHTLSPGSWDSQMAAYPYVVDAAGKRMMFFNGNGFGALGFGVATWKE